MRRVIRVKGRMNRPRVALLQKSAKPTNVTLFFERNRAFMSVFKRRDGRYEQHHFEVDPPSRTITIWDQWLSKGPVLFRGTYQMNGDELKITGQFGKESSEVAWILRRRAQAPG